MNSFDKIIHVKSSKSYPESVKPSDHLPKVKQDKETLVAKLGLIFYLKIRIFFLVLFYWERGLPSFPK